LDIMIQLESTFLIFLSQKTQLYVTDKRAEITPKPDARQKKYVLAGKDLVKIWT
jgi:hypothetical protein